MFCCVLHIAHTAFCIICLVSCCVIYVLRHFHNGGAPTWCILHGLHPRLFHSICSMSHGIYRAHTYVMVMEAPTSFSPFSLNDCTLYSHFSFDDFVMVAFPDFTRDLDDPI